mmetsp:Transcript_19888/g.24550  ORF Transcript_19888/g.24550 Transcript_19888/m.24550 type:complete len:330 (-) Transcript_19888:219-1208(-)|eukprot:CAMPEP_0172496838 /NCGR_PEP_ID=MMETSP1066-20121228/93776_1 /TAXON_ID=671091 /ORGANISM="Coscinodiscus wailesii, Strain CCMP2513" /LENGTH=329 /DNA_ID=CAMNT_0013269337 /DNA_START=24 /DNA_END=1013 /DNA_ORIENTATION=+
MELSPVLKYSSWLIVASTICNGFVPSLLTPQHHASPVVLNKAPVDSDFAVPRTTSDRLVDANRYNVDLDTAAELWTVSMQQERSAVRDAGVPYMDSKSKDYFVDDVEDVVVSRDGGLGLELLELAGGREDGFGITIVTVVGEGSNAEKAGILPGDSIASVSVISSTTDSAGNVEQVERTAACECMDFDNTIAALTQFPGDKNPELILGIKRMRRWPKVMVEVAYPPAQCAEGADNKEMVELFAGENLQRALLNRRIIMEDPNAPKCDFCGNKCTVSVEKGMNLLNPAGLTEQKIMANNPKCRLSCKTTVGYNMQEGDLKLRINLRVWNE